MSLNNFLGNNLLGNNLLGNNLLGNNLLGNIVQNSVNNTEANSKGDFITKYSNYSNEYDKLTPLGGQKKVWPYFINILLLISAIICLYYGREKVDENKVVIPRNNMEELIYKLGWILLIIFLISLAYSGYNYFALYLPQYSLWYNMLPLEAKNQLRVINALEAVNINRRNNNR